MNTNKHGTKEENGEHLVANISIYHARKTELYAMRYDAMNMRSTCVLYYIMCSLHGCLSCIFVGLVVSASSLLSRVLAVAVFARLNLLYYDAM